MVTIECINCNRNLGKRTCEIYPDYIPTEAISTCDKFEKMSDEDFDKKIDKGINVVEGFSDEDD